ncbi:MAG: hypothetical protein OXM55_03150 [Bdellovibrionales bacterium]|nr:hypothetical protein [Bdellovibrionales bacterium]
MDVFTELYKKVLLFPYWQTRLPSLQQVLKEELTAFGKFYYSSQLLHLENLVSTDQWQLITIQKQSDLIHLVDDFLQSNISKGDRVHVLPLDKERVLGLILRSNKNLDVLSFSPLAIMNQGKLEPLSPLSELYYSDQYELRPVYRQILEDGNLNFIHFSMKGPVATGYQCQGFCFQQQGHFKKNLKEVESLFCLLKQIESQFIQSKSDPHYKQLIQALHNHYRQILTAALTPHNRLETEQLLSQATKALKDLYPQDRLLFLLTANIDFHFRKKEHETKGTVNTLR